MRIKQGSNTAIFENLPEDEYRILIEDKYGCSLESDISVIDPVPFFVDLGADKLINLGEAYYYFTRNELQHPAVFLDASLGGL